MEIVTKIAPIALALIMLGLGLGLTLRDFTRVLIQPRDFLVGLICQLILLPIIAFILIKIFNISIELALGVMIIAAAPGGVTSNILTKFSNGDVALSISLTAIISLISIFSVPFIVFKSADLLQFSNVSKNITSKDKKGNPNTFSLIISVKLGVQIDNGELVQKDFSQSSSYSNNSNKFDLKKYENSLTKNLTEKISKDIILYLQDFDI